ncbi:single-stranded DNA-binding protein [Streptomyces sp. NPDC048664]|uniref:single-stranded DNA-binding protein n=1 Tax=Streptomyces sp. NPDC048664 TaxID=3154505 RepID=UPI003435584C
MNETTVCVVGNVATQPVYRESPTGPTARFRLAVTARYLDREKNEWTDGHTNFFTVWARRSLATNVGASVSVGDPLVVQGRLRVRTEQRDGQGWLSADLDAAAIGHDLSRGTSAFRRANRTEPQSGVHAGAGGDVAPRSEPEPEWETAPPGPPGPVDGDRHDPVPQPHLEGAGVT